MRISRLAEAAGLPVATVKYYLRAGLLPPGHPTSATQATYDESHLRRLRLVRALIEVGGLSHAQVRAVLACLDAEPTNLHEILGAAHAALSPAAGSAPAASRARALVDRLGWRVGADTPALAQLDHALTAAHDLGLPTDDERLATYARAAADVAAVEVAGVPRDSVDDALIYLVTGVVLFEPVLLALRRLAQEDASVRLFGTDP